MKPLQITKAAVSFCLINLSVGHVYADAISEIESNNSIAMAQNIDDAFNRHYLKYYFT
uniref:Uncharacterized protein n=1 Tax=Candidatus Kentrum sp. LPFa TaxID=2126335 RepID=A0A450WZK3_9GAMM|nr:MAG: hypothetical protein BECKLPF1236A_GA0070988_103453 [Candidatus Kentron sp. LPFa]VFK35130.1 MAG: hypothetical protein BECKLPF1236C_GA0070990_103353 [Candidatus Kentron sp. LPFa]